MKKTISARVASDIAEKIKRDADESGINVSIQLEKICKQYYEQKKDTKSDVDSKKLERSLVFNSCIFRVDISEEDKILCMKDFNLKGKVHSLNPRACDQCYQKGLISPTAPSIKDQETKSNLVVARKSGPQKKVPTFSTTFPNTFCPQQQKEIKANECEYCKRKTWENWRSCQEWKRENPDSSSQRDLTK